MSFIDHPRSMCWQKSTKSTSPDVAEQKTHAGHIPERSQALAEMQRLKERAALDPTLARPSTPLPAGRELQTTHGGGE